MSDFNYNAPQYIDFTSDTALELHDFGEEYFDTDHEVEVQYSEVTTEDEFKEAKESNYFLQQQNSEITNGSNLSKQQATESYTLTSTSSYRSGNSCDDEVIVINDSVENISDIEITTNYEKPPLRKSVSAGNIISIVEEEEKMENTLIACLDKLQFNTPAVVKSQTKPTKLHMRTAVLPSKPSIIPMKKPTSLQKRKSISRDGLNLYSNSNLLKRKISVDNLNVPQQNKYISMAEAVRRFQNSTPQRFHSKSNKTQFCTSGPTKPFSLMHTVAQSPDLATKTRIRQTYYESHEQQLKREAEEMKKYHIKANPVNPKIFRTPVPPPKKELPKTEIQPFKLTEIKPHSIQPLEKPVTNNFHAKPAPKTTAPGAVPVAVRKSIMPKLEPVKRITPRKKFSLPVVDNSFRNNSHVIIKTVEIPYSGMSKLVSNKPTKTEIKPFSFEERDKRIQERKEELKRKALEEEKKLREFHAKPIPVKVLGQAVKVESKVAKLISDPHLLHAAKSKVTDENTEPLCFKARPATVIHKKPFIPKKEDRPLVEIQEFHLNTIDRAKEREEFEKKQKEKEELLEKLKKEMEKQENEKLDKMIKQERKERVIHANPIKKYKPVIVEPSSKEVTSPISPFKSRKHLHMK